MRRESDPKKEFAPVELKIKPPLGDKSWMVSFDADSENACQAYNYAIETVAKEARLNPFHQAGVTPFGANQPGYHAWEFWRKTDEIELQSLLAKIEETAQGWLSRWAE
jgi:hypothetical protein